MTLKQRVLDALKQHPEGLTATKCGETLNESYANVGVTLYDLWKSRKIERLPKKGPKGGYRYYLPPFPPDIQAEIVSGKLMK